jgi:uncharacterized membrane protein
MANYIIIGGDGKEYGPVPDADVRQWIAEGRLAAASLAKGEGDAEFRPLEKFPELAALFGPTTLNMAATPSPIAPLQPTRGFAPASSAAALPDDYELDIIGCLSRGFELMKENLGTLVLGSLVYCVIQMAVGMLGNIPILGLVFTVANFICAGPLLAGLMWLFIRVNRGEAASVADVFAGFQRKFLHLFLSRLVQVVIMAVCFLPVLIMFGAKFYSLMQQLKHIQPGSPPDPEVGHSLLTMLLAALPMSLVCAIPAIFFSVCFIFALPLVIDRQMNFIEGLKTSWRMVIKHWFLVFGLLALTGLLNIVGVLLCCVGVLFTLPIGFGALACAYETIFGTAKK